jgi:hypothetical protein
MGLTVPTTRPPERDDQPMPYDWFVGIDWGSQQHQVCVLDRDRRRVGERVVSHDGASLARLADWLWTMSVGQPQRVAVAIEGVPVASVQETTIRGSTVKIVGKNEGLRPHILGTKTPDFAHVCCGISPMNKVFFPTSAACLVCPTQVRRVFQIV